MDATLLNSISIAILAVAIIWTNITLARVVRRQR